MQKADIETGGFENVDLNHLRTLRALIESASITKAAEVLGLSQPAASRAVAKLRLALGDPLLVRTTKGYVLTQAAESLHGKVIAALSAAESVFASNPFQPSTSKRKFLIGSTDYGTMAVLVPAIKRILEEAPGISLSLLEWRENTLEDLESGKLDLALFADGDLPSDFHVRKLFVESYVLITRKGHPIGKLRTRSLEAFGAAVGRFRHLQARYPDGRKLIADDILARLGLASPTASFATPHFSTAPLLIAESDLLMLIPRRVAEIFRDRIPIEIIEIPSRQEDFPYNVIWHERAHRDPGVKWVRDRLAMVARIR